MSSVIHETIPFRDEQDAILFQVRGNRQFSPLGFHTHDDLEFNLVTSGSGQYLTPAGRFNIRVGHLFWWFPSQPHALQMMSPDSKMWVAVFPRRLLQSACRDDASAPLLSSDPPENGQVVMLEPRVLEELDHGMQRLSNAVREGVHQDWLNAGYRFLLLHAWRASREWAVAEAAHEGLLPAVYAAAKRLHDDPGIDCLPELASELGLSYEHLSRTFRRQIGVTLVAYRNEQRLRRYRSIRDRNSGVTTMTAAMEAGFGSYAQFFRIYREHYGKRPSAD